MTTWRPSPSDGEIRQYSGPPLDPDHASLDGVSFWAD
jgi:hypothetical protein